MKSSKMKLALSFSICIFCFTACFHDNQRKKDIIVKPDSNRNAVVFDTSVKFYREGQRQYILLDTEKFQIPAEDSISNASIYKGIIDFKSKSLERRSFLISKNLAFFTTFDDVGTGYRAYLYVFDLTSRSLIKDSTFKHDFLFSSAGVFVIDPDNDRVFAVDKDAWFDAKGISIVPASLYTVKGAYFNDLKCIYMLGNEIPNDSAVLAFFKNSISPKGNGVFKLPYDWWKIKSHKYF